MMAKTYERYLKLNIDGSCLGLERSENESAYFCTPKGAKVIGWAGVDGIHYCLVRGFGEMVFAVSPTNTPGDYVHPIARNFVDFLRLLLVCGDTAALEQAHCWDRAQFDAFLQDNPFTGEQQGALEAIREEMGLAPMEQPFAYIRELQSGFDYSRIKYTKDYYEWVPAEPKISEWKVYFDSSFWGHRSCERACREISHDKQFVWGDEVWRIPAIYTCGKGWVVDLCKEVSPERIRCFMEKWQFSAENEGAGLTDEQRMQVSAENPLDINAEVKLVLNGTVLSFSHSSGLSWNPLLPEGNGLEAESVIRHYGLDPTRGWAVRRIAFPWTKKRKPQMETLSVTLTQEPVAVSGPHFHVSVPGESIEFTHPATGTQHRLTVQQYEREVLSPEDFGSRDQEFPANCTVMSYTLSPDLADGAFGVMDCARSDEPRQKSSGSNGPQRSSCIGIAIIGSADGPTAVIFGGAGQGKVHTAYSALHFEPAEVVEWRMVFYEKNREDITVEILSE